MQVENKEERIALFFAKLDHMLELTARQLHERMEFQKTAYAKQFPLLMSSLWLGSEKLKPNDSIASVINQGTLGIGFIGLAECLVALTGKHHGEDEDSQALGVRIVTYIRDRANQFSEQLRLKACPASSREKIVRSSDRSPVSRIGIIIRTLITSRYIISAVPVIKPKWKLLIMI